jgi:hypothetical protein
MLRPRSAAHGVGIVLVLNTQPFVQSGIEKPPHIPGCVDLGRACLKKLINHDSVGYFQFRIPGRVYIQNGSMPAITLWSVINRGCRDGVLSSILFT